MRTSQECKQNIAANPVQSLLEDKREVGRSKFNPSAVNSTKGIVQMNKKSIHYNILIIRLRSDIKYA